MDPACCQNRDQDRDPAGRHRGEVRAHRALYRALPPDTAAAFISLKNRRPDLWRDKKEVEETHAQRGETKVVYELSPEAQRLLDETLAELGQPPYEPPSEPNGGARKGNGATKH